MAEHDLHAIAFPTLDDAQIAEFGGCTHAVSKVYRDGETLFAVGDRYFKFHVIRSGEVNILDYSGTVPMSIHIHRKGSFTGDISHLTGNASIVTAVAKSDCEVYEISSEALKQALNQCPSLSDIVLQAFIARRQLVRQSPDFTGLRVIGSRYSQDTFRVRDFLAKNHVKFTWTDLETDPQVDKMLKQFNVTEADTPVIACSSKLLLRNPTNRQLAERIGIRHPLEQTVYDLVVVGAGPAGLAAAVYGASEGLQTAVLERTAPGGQAGTSMRIENYLGFPAGVTGSELTDRAILQANKFGARIAVTSPVTHLTFDKSYCMVHLEGEEPVTAKCLLIATGVDYRRLGVEGEEQFEGRGIYYAATPMEAQMCRGTQVLLVGGGNSAGQAAVFLSGHANKVFVVIRGKDLYKDMSSYLARRVEQTANIEVLSNTTIQKMCGNGQLAAVELLNHQTGQTRTVETPAVFTFIGAVPRTEWLPDEIERDNKGFIRTGQTLAQSPYWSSPRQPFLLETSRAGVFAAGDVRSDSIKRVASAVGEGAMAVKFVHEYLKEM